MNDEALYRAACGELILRKGFHLRGACGAISMPWRWDSARGSTRPTWHIGRPGRNLADSLLDAEIPVLQPPGGHAVYWMPGASCHIPREEFPALSLVLEIYLEGGVRGVEVGSVMFAREDPATGKMLHPRLELVRLAIPRRVYTQAHLDHVVNTLKRIRERRATLRGYRMTFAPELLRHFTAQFEPL